MTEQTPKLHLNPGHAEIVVKALGKDKLKQYSEFQGEENEELPYQEYTLRRIRSNSEHGLRTEMELTPEQLSYLFGGEPEAGMEAKSAIIDALRQEMANLISGLKGDLSYLVESFPQILEQDGLGEAVGYLTNDVVEISEQLDLVLAIEEKAKAIQKAIKRQAQTEQEEHQIAYDAWYSKKDRDPKLQPQMKPFGLYDVNVGKLLKYVEQARTVLTSAREVLESTLINGDLSLNTDEGQEELDRLNKLPK